MSVYNAPNERKSQEVTFVFIRVISFAMFDRLLLWIGFANTHTSTTIHGV